jgi:sortase A
VRTPLRILGTVCAAAGILAVLWALVVWQWQDPFTALYTHQQQRRLAAAFEQQASAFAADFEPTRQSSQTSVAAEEKAVLRAATRYRHQLETGAPVGRLRVPRLGLNAIVVDGTDHDSLTKGPGRYEKSYVPGEGQLVYVAGHRTTYGAPFAHIERLRKGDSVTFELPYATFLYRVRNTAIVPSDEVGRLRSHGNEVIVLQACHPRFFATERYLVYATPVRVVPRGGPGYAVRT